MRIVQLVDSLDCGGAEQVAASLAVCQSRQGHSVRVVCLRDLGLHPVDTAALLKAGVEIETLEKPPGFHFGTLRKLKDYLESHRIEVLHTHNHLVHHYGAIAGHWAGTPAILNTLHGTNTLRMASLAKVLYWLSCLVSDRVVSVSSQVHEVFRKAYLLPGKRLSVIENGIDLSQFLVIPRCAPDGVVTFGNIGRFDPVKDHENLFRAFSILRKRNLHVRLRLLGDGELRRDMVELAKTLSITNDIELEGFSLDTPKFLSKIDIYVISSLSEGLPISLLEAMGAGLPVVATAVGGITEILDNARCGWLCPPANPNALAEAMNESLVAPDLVTIGARGRMAAEKHYSVERMSRDYEVLYGTLLSGRTARPAKRSL
jgi:glycosyltransferase involved in cell wall biosynthesis